ncbi:MAG: cation:proton antiporter [Caulobacteraceae bacterium]
MIEQLAEIGVITLMFIAGLETDIFGFKKSLNYSSGIALGGVALPLLLGYLTASFFGVGNHDTNLFVGVVLTATSVSITVRTLQEMDKLQSKPGYAILGAAIIDDLIGIVPVSFIIGLSTDTGSIVSTLVKIIIFFIFALLVGKVVGTGFNNYCIKIGQKQRIPIFAFAFCLAISYISERFFGVSAVTGAYIAGISLAASSSRDYILSKVNILSYMLLMPIFFVSIGLKSIITPSLPWLFIITLSAVAVAGKIFGCGIPAKLFGFDT